MAPKFANQLPIRNVGRTCNGSGNVWNWELRSWCTGTLENTPPHKIRCDILKKFLQRGDVMRAICVETTQRNADELRKPTHQSVWFADLRIRDSNFRNYYTNEADHMTKSDLHNGQLIGCSQVMPGCPTSRIRHGTVLDIKYILSFPRRNSIKLKGRGWVGGGAIKI